MYKTMQWLGNQIRLYLGKIIMDMGGHMTTVVTYVMEKDDLQWYSIMIRRIFTLLKPLHLLKSSYSHVINALICSVEQQLHIINANKNVCIIN